MVRQLSKPTRGQAPRWGGAWKPAETPSEPRTGTFLAGQEGKLSLRRVGEPNRLVHLDIDLGFSDAESPFPESPGRTGWFSDGTNDCPRCLKGCAVD